MLVLTTLFPLIVFALLAGAVALGQKLVNRPMKTSHSPSPILSTINNIKPRFLHSARFMSKFIWSVVLPAAIAWEIYGRPCGLLIGGVLLPVFAIPRFLRCRRTRTATRHVLLSAALAALVALAAWRFLHVSVHVAAGFGGLCLAAILIADLVIHWRRTWRTAVMVTTITAFVAVWAYSLSIYWFGLGITPDHKGAWSTLLPIAAAVGGSLVTPVFLLAAARWDHRNMMRSRQDGLMRLEQARTWVSNQLDQARAGLAALGNDQSKADLEAEIGDLQGHLDQLQGRMERLRQDQHWLTPSVLAGMLMNFVAQLLSYWLATKIFGAAVTVKYLLVQQTVLLVGLMIRNWLMARNGSDRDVDSLIEAVSPLAVAPDMDTENLKTSKWDYVWMAVGGACLYASLAGMVWTMNHSVAWHLFGARIDSVTVFGSSIGVVCTAFLLLTVRGVQHGPKVFQLAGWKKGNQLRDMLASTGPAFLIGLAANGLGLLLGQMLGNLVPEHWVPGWQPGDALSSSIQAATTISLLGVRETVGNLLGTFFSLLVMMRKKEVKPQAATQQTTATGGPRSQG